MHHCLFFAEQKIPQMQLNFMSISKYKKYTNKTKKRESKIPIAPHGVASCSSFRTLNIKNVFWNIKTMACLHVFHTFMVALNYFTFQQSKQMIEFWLPRPQPAIHPPTERSRVGKFTGWRIFDKYLQICSCWRRNQLFI